MIYIGIDPGTHTGFAVWDSERKTFAEVSTYQLFPALERVKELRLSVGRNNIKVIFEDARQRTWFGKGNVNAKQQGAGSIKRDCTIWEEFCIGCDVPFWAKPPVKGMTKMDAQRFKALTKWQGRTSNHARDAAMMVFGM